MNILRRLASGKLKMADIIGRTFFDLPLTSMSESVHTSSAVLADLENVGVVFVILLQSYIEDEILRYFLSASGNGTHL